MRQIWDADRGSLWGEPRLAVAAIGVAVASTALFATLLAAPIDPVLALFTAKSAIATNTMIIADYPVPHRAPQPRSGALALPAEVEGSTAPAASEEAPAPQLAGGEAPQRSEAGEETPSRSAAGGEEQSRNATAEEAQAHNAAGGEAQHHSAVGAETQEEAEASRGERTSAQGTLDPEEASSTPRTTPDPKAGASSIGALSDTNKSSLDKQTDSKTQQGHSAYLARPDPSCGSGGSP